MKKITLYTTSQCPYCKIAKDYLNANGYSFEEVNVENDEQAAQNIMKLSGQMGVPVIDIDGHVIVGWNKQLMDKVLEGDDWNPAIQPKGEESETCESCQ